MIQPQHTEQIAAYLAGELSPEEGSRLMAWVESDPANRAYFEELVDTWAATADADTAPFEVTDPEVAWSKIEDRLSAGGAMEDPSPIVPIGRKAAQNRFRWYGFAAAASVLLLLAVGLFLLSDDQPVDDLVTIRTADQPEQLALPDGSEVRLLANSELVYYRGFQARNVQLIGAAFFDVQPDSTRPFRITTSETVTTVLGTAFTVRAYPGEDSVEVKVEVGTVAVGLTATPDDPEVLEAGEKVIYKRKTDSLERLEAPVEAAMPADIVDEPLYLVLPKLEAHFRKEFKAASDRLLDCKIRMNYKKETLESVLETLQFMGGFEVQAGSGPDTIVLNGTGCR